MLFARFRYERPRESRGANPAAHRNISRSVQDRTHPERQLIDRKRLG